jgi:excisionase family DNA binding protein
MHELEIKGKKYISSKRAAELTGYAKDYVGQLAREQKIPATRVGRSWYVSEEAILEHSGKGNTENTISKEAASGLSLQRFHQSGLNPGSFKTWSQVTYITDESDLKPTPSVKENQIVIRVAEAATDKNEPQKTVPERKKPSHDTILPRRRILPVMPILSSGSLVALFVAAFVLQAEWFFLKPPFSSVSLSASSEGIDTVWGLFIEIFHTGISVLGGFLNIISKYASSFFIAGLQFIFGLF